MVTLRSASAAKLAAAALAFFLIAGCCSLVPPSQRSGSPQDGGKSGLAGSGSLTLPDLSLQAQIQRELEEGSNGTVEINSLIDLKMGQSVMATTITPTGSGDDFIENAHYYRSPAGQYILISKSGYRWGNASRELEESLMNSDRVAVPD